MLRSTWEQVRGVRLLSGTGLLPSLVRLSRPVLLEDAFVTPRRRCASCKFLSHDPRCATGAPLTHTGFRLFPVRSPLLGESRLLSVPRGTKMFQFPRLPSHAYVFSMRWPDITPARLPHSGIPGSKPACGSPGLIAACCALHRPLAPRHPPCALSSLKTSPAAFV